MVHRASLFVLLGLNETFEGVNLTNELCFRCFAILKLLEKTLDLNSGIGIGRFQEATEIIDSKRLATVLILFLAVSHVHKIEYLEKFATHPLTHHPLV